LVHGGWSGSWIWRFVADRLRARAHAVYTPSLTGLGERAHLAGPDVDLSTHIKDVCNAIFYEDISGITLVGHSYGGMVVTGVADCMPERIRHVVYVDAFVPESGQSLIDISGRVPPGDDWRVPPIPRSVPDPELQEWIDARRVDQPRATMEEKLQLRVALEDQSFSRTYVWASADPLPGPFVRIAERLRDHPAWRYHELPTSHLVPLTMSSELTEILLELGA